MALSMAEKLTQAAATRIAKTAAETNARLDGMDSKKAPRPPVQLHTEKSDPDGTQATEVTPQSSAVFQHDDSAQQGNITLQHHNTAPFSSTSAPQPSNSAPQTSPIIQQDNSAYKSSTSYRHNEATPQNSTTLQQDNAALQIDTSRGSATLIHICLDAPALARTPAQKRMLRYFEEHGHHVSNYDKIIAETGLRYGTVRDIVDRFGKQGIITKKPWIQGSARGIHFAFHGISRHDNPACQSNTIIQHVNTTRQNDTTRSHHKVTPQSNAFYKIDRENLSISLSAGRIALTWPNLARAGFGCEQLDQIAAALAELGKSTEKIVQSLDHAEWELERGQMLDKDGQPVTDPCSWVFTALARTGYYRRPKAYVSPEEQAAKDTEAEAKAVVAARQAAEQAQFEAWREGLLPDELTDALRGHPGGPKDAWLKKIWRDRRKSDTVSS